MQDFKEYAKDFADTSREVHGGCGFEAGFFHSMSIAMYQYLPEAQQRQFLNQMRLATDKLVDSLDI